MAARHPQVIPQGFTLPPIDLSRDASVVDSLKILRTHPVFAVAGTHQTQMILATRIAYLLDVGSDLDPRALSTFAGFLRDLNNVMLAHDAQAAQAKASAQDDNLYGLRRSIAQDRHVA